VRPAASPAPDPLPQVNAPAKALAACEALTRDADAPEDASGASIPAPPPSKLAAMTLHGGKAANGVANGTAKGVH
jgi:hypothetical protein